MRPLLSVEQALRALVSKLDEVHNDERYKSVWTLYMIHGGSYDGPKYEQELDDAKLSLMYSDHRQLNNEEGTQ